MTETLNDALKRVWRHRWLGTKSALCLLSQAEKAIETLQERYRVTKPKFSQLLVEDAQPFVGLAVAYWQKEGLSQATINKRLNCLGALGVDVGGYRKKPKAVAKWWLKPVDARKALTFCHEHIADSLKTPEQSRKWYLMGAYITFVSHTGLRVEETLDLRWGDVMFHEMHGVPWDIDIRGTKTEASRATLPLPPVPREILGRLFKLLRCLLHVQEDKVFPLSYDELNTMWQEVRKHIGAEDNPTATLKALRRTAARYLHVDCNMPIAMVQQYLRHENVQTTMEYLRLTGGYGTEEMRRFFK